jgi:pentatricopeptide repeat protein
VVAYTILLRLYGQTGKIELAEETFLEMLEAGVEPDAVACGTLLCAYARRGQHDDMMLFYAATRRRGVAPPVSAFNFMLSSLQKHRLHDKVIYMWKEMVEEANVVPNQFTYTVVIGSFVKQSLLEEAMDVLRKMKRSQLVPDEATYSVLISLSARHGRGEQAVRLYEEMRDHGIVPSNYTCASLLALYDKNQDYAKALSLFSEMERSRVILDEVIYGILVRIYGKIGLYEDAQRTFEEIDRAGLLRDEQTYVAMANVHMNAGNYDRALQVLDSMRSSSVKPSPFSYNALLRCHVAKEDVAAAEDAFRVLSKYGLPDVFCCNDLLRLYVKLGHLDKASALILQMRKEDVQLDEGLCMTVMEVCCKSGMAAGADKVLKDMHNNGVTMKNSSMVSLIEIYARNRISVIQDEDSSSKALDCRADHSALRTTLKSLLDSPGGSSIACQLIRKFAREGEKARFYTERGVHV